MNTVRNAIKSRKEQEREMDVYIGSLFENTTWNYEDCYKEFLKKYPKESAFFHDFFLDYSS
jgi:hypothetical protein